MFTRRTSIYFVDRDGHRVGARDAIVMVKLEPFGTMWSYTTYVVAVRSFKVGRRKLFEAVPTHVEAMGTSSSKVLARYYATESVRRRYRSRL
jgi:hypothetical protein